jgi:hypothetical protein
MKTRIYIVLGDRVGNPKWRNGTPAKGFINDHIYIRKIIHISDIRPPIAPNHGVEFSLCARYGRLMPL